MPKPHKDSKKIELKAYKMFQFINTGMARIRVLSKPLDLMGGVSAGFGVIECTSESRNVYRNCIKEKGRKLECSVRAAKSFSRCVFSKPDIPLEVIRHWMIMKSAKTATLCLLFLTL